MEISLNKPEKIKLDFKDSKYATGRRKTSIAKIWLKKGSGKIYVNGKNYEDYFKRATHKMQLLRPFAIIVARRVYRQIGRKIIQKRNMENYEKSGKIYVNNFGKIYQTILSLFDLMFLYLKDVESHQRIKEHEIIREEISLDERI